MKVYRICKSKYAHDHSGKGAALYGGRWNSKNLAMVYTSSSIALAALEVIAHLGDIHIPVPYSLVIYDIDDASIVDVSMISIGDAYASLNSMSSCQKTGNDFIIEGKFVAMKVPSAIIPMEYNYVINSKHPDFDDKAVIDVVPFEWDKRVIRK